MALSEGVRAAITRELLAAWDILGSPKATESQRTLARFVIAQWAANPAQENA